MHAFDSKTWLESVGEFAQRPVGRALAWGVPVGSAITALLWGLWRWMS